MTQINVQMDANDPRAAQWSAAHKDGRLIAHEGKVWMVATAPASHVGGESGVVREYILREATAEEKAPKT